jgi:hypothetical protein
MSIVHLPPLKLSLSSLCVSGILTQPAYPIADAKGEGEKSILPKGPPPGLSLKGLSHEIDFKNVDENGQILALLRATAGF